jgi:hypothetical protein
LNASTFEATGLAALTTPADADALKNDASA